MRRTGISYCDHNDGQLCICEVQNVTKYQMHQMCFSSSKCSKTRFRSGLCREWTPPGKLVSWRRFNPPIPLPLHSFGVSISASRLSVTARLSLQIKHCSPLLPGLHFAADDSRSICRVYQSSLYFPMVSWTINILGLGLAYILLSSSSAAAAAVATVVTWSSACQ